MRTKSVRTLERPPVKRVLSGSPYHRAELTVVVVSVPVLAAVLPRHLGC